MKSIKYFAMCALVAGMVSCDFIDPIDNLDVDFTVDVNFGDWPDNDDWAAMYAEATDDGEGLKLDFSFIRKPEWPGAFLPAIEAYVKYDRTEFGYLTQVVEPWYFDYFSRVYFTDGRDESETDAQGTIYYGDWEVYRGTVAITDYDTVLSRVSGTVELVMLDAYDFWQKGSDYWREDETRTPIQKNLTVTFEDVPVFVSLPDENTKTDAKNPKYSHYRARRPR